MDSKARIERSVLTYLVGMPPSRLRTIVGREVRSPDGHVLDLQTQALIWLAELTRVPEIHAVGVSRGRANMERSTKIVGPKPAPGVDSRDLAVDGASGPLNARWFTPSHPTGALVVYFHGGGFVLGSPDSHDLEGRALAAQSGASVLSVDYRLAPEHKFPAAVDDAVAAFRWAARNARDLGCDPARIAVAGDSAGGNLAAVVAIETRNDAIAPRLQVLIYPATDMTHSQRSHTLFWRGFILTAASIDWFLESYLAPTDSRTHPRASPLFAADLRGCAPAVVVTAGFDPLRDEGHAYAERLREAGVPVTYRCHEGLIHGFFSMSGVIAAAATALGEIAGDLRAGLAERPTSATTAGTPSQPRP